MLDDSFDLLRIDISPEVVLDSILRFHNGQRKSKNLPTEARLLAVYLQGSCLRICRIIKMHHVLQNGWTA